MGRHTESKCKLCRREGAKLFLKGARCETAKCPVEKRGKPPGMHVFRRRRPSAYGIRLREKQKVKRFYGIGETQFRRVFDVAGGQKGNTGQNMLVLLERRLDNVVKLVGFAWSRAAARQLVSHGHIQVNGRKVDVPSYVVKEGDIIRPEPTDAMLTFVKNTREDQGQPEPGWVAVNEADMTARVVRLPVRADVTAQINEGLVVEFCSR